MDLKLIGLACFLANSNSYDVVQIQQSLTEQEMIDVERIMDSNVCLPENFRKLVTDESGEVLLSQPCSNFGPCAKFQ